MALRSVRCARMFVVVSMVSPRRTPLHIRRKHRPQRWSFFSAPEPQGQIRIDQAPRLVGLPASQSPEKRPSWRISGARMGHSSAMSSSLQPFD